MASTRQRLLNQFADRSVCANQNNFHKNSILISDLRIYLFISNPWTPGVQGRSPHSEYIVVEVVSEFERSHLSDRLNRVYPTVLLRHGLESRRSNEIAIARLQFFASVQSIHLLLAALDRRIIADKDQVVGVSLDRSAHILAKDSGRHHAQPIASRPYKLAFDTRSLHPSARPR